MQKLISDLKCFYNLTKDSLKRKLGMIIKRVKWAFKQESDLFKICLVILNNKKIIQSNYFREIKKMKKKF